MPTTYYNTIATVAAVNGMATVRNSEGETRVLKPGDVLLEGDTIITAPGNSVELAMNDGELMLFSGGEDILLTPDMLANASPGADESALQEQTVDDIVTALETGENIDDLLEETAAGGSPTDEGNSFVRLGRVLESTGRSLDFEPAAAAQTPEFVETGTGELPGNVAPLAQDIVASVNEDDVLEGAVSATDFNNDTLTYTLLDPAPEGLTFNTDGSYTFEPNAEYLAVGQTEELTLTYQVADGNGGVDTASLTITIHGENDLPVIPGASENVAIEGGEIISGSVVASDIDNGDILTFSLVGPAPAGLTFNADGSYSFDPSDLAYDSLKLDEILDIEIPYQVDDGNGGIVSDTLTIHVTGTDDPSTLTLTATDSITEAGGIITCTATVDRPALSDLQIQLDNGETITILAGETTGSTDVVVASMDDVYLDSGSLDFTIESTSGGDYENLDFTTHGSASTQITDTIDTSVVTLSAPVSITEAQSTITYTATVDNSPETDLQLNLSNGETITILAGQFSGSVDVAIGSDEDLINETTSVDVSIDSASGGNYELLDTTTSVSTQVVDTIDSVTVLLSANSAVSEDGGVITYTANLFDTDGNNINALSDITVTLANGEVITITNGSSSGSASSTVNADDVYLESDSAISNSITQIDGGEEFEQLVGIGGAVNTALTDDTDIVSATLSADATVVEGDAITYTVNLSHPAIGDVEIELSTGTSITVLDGESSGSATFLITDDNVLEIGEQISASITSLTGGSFESVDTSSTVITAVLDNDGDSPVFTLVGDSSVTEGASASYQIALGGVDIGDGVSITLSVESGLLIDSADENVDYNSADGTLSITGPFSIGDNVATFTVSTDNDGINEGSENFTVTLTGSTAGTAIGSVVTTIIDAQHDPVVSGVINENTHEDASAFSVDLLQNANDEDSGDVLNISNLVKSSGDDSGISSSGNSLSVNPSVYNHLAVGESVTVNYSYDVIDGNGGVVSTSAVITIEGRNDTPTVSSAISETTNEDATTFAVDLLQNASDVDTSDSLTISNISTSGDDSGISISSNSLNVDPSAYSYLAVGESTTVTVNYDVIDGNGGVVATSAEITIEGRNDAPVVSSAISETTNEDASSFSVDLLQNASDVDNTDSLSVSNISSSGDDSGISVSGNTLNVDPSAYNHLAVGESVTVTYNYDIFDGSTTTTTSAEITIEGRNDTPVVSSAISESSNEDASGFSVDLLQNASDVDTSDILSIDNLTMSGDASGISVSGNSLTVDPSAYHYLAQGESVVVTCTYNVIDSHGGVVPTTASITIDGRDDAPEVTVDSYNTSEGATLTVDTASGVLANDADPEGQAIHVSQVASDTNGSGAIAVDGVSVITTVLGGIVLMNADGSYSYTAPSSLDHTSNDTLQDSFSYKASDSTDESEWTTVSLAVADTAPIALNDMDSVGVGGTVIGNVISGAGGDGNGQDTLGADTAVITEVVYNSTTYLADGEGNFSITTANGSVVINQDGSYRYDSSHSVADPVSVGGNSLADWSDVTLYGFEMGTAFESNNTLNLNASDNTVAYRSGRGLRIDSIGDSDNGAELDANTNASEAIAIDFGEAASNAQVTVSSMGGDDGGRWTAYDSEGNFIESGVFSTTTFSVTPSESFQYLVFDGVDSTDDYNISSLIYQPSVQGLEIPDDVFTYTLQDSDGDTSSANLTVNHDTTILAMADSATVYESGLDNGSDAGNNATIVSGNILDNDEGINTDASITQLNAGVDTQTPDANGVITLTTASGELQVYTQDYDGNRAGDYQYTLNAANHEGDGAVDLFNYTVSDGYTSSTNSLTVNIVDDAPVSADITANLQSGGETTTCNLIIVLDTSGSMNVPVNDDQTRLDVAISALEALIESVDDAGNVNVKIVEFSDETNSSAWFQDDVYSAIEFLNELRSGGSTHYDEALMEVIEMDSAEIPEADQTLIYFVSDGEPSSGHGLDESVVYIDGEGNSLSGQAAWESYVAENVDIAFGIGIGAAGLSDLEQIAYPNDDINADGQGDYAMMLSDPTELTSTLLQTVTENLISGSFGLLGTGTSNGFLIGADGGYISAITVDGTSYSYDPNAGDPQAVTVNTLLGGVLVLNFATGEYNYSIDLQETQLDEQESFMVTAVDNDGDSATANLIFNLNYESDSDANRDIVITNISDGSVIEIPSLALLHNDSVTADSAISATGNPVSGTVSGTETISVTLGGGNDGFGATATTINEDAADSESNPLNTVDFINNIDNAVDFTDRTLFGTVEAAEAANLGDANAASAKFSGRLDASSDKDADWIKVSLKAGERITLDIDNGSNIGESVNTYITLYNSNGDRLEHNIYRDETTGGEGSINHEDAYLSYEVAADGEYYVRVTSLNDGDSGDYDLWMSIDPNDTTMSFDYTLNSAGYEDTTTVDVSAVQGDTLTGSASDEILIAGSTNDTLDAGAGDDVLIANDGDDTLLGGDGDDLLIGGQGDDLLIGGLGTDVFKWELNDAGTTANPSEDTISQFDNSASGDILDLSDLLVSETESELESYLHFENQGADTVIHINTSGGFSEGFSSALSEQTIVMENVDLTSGFADQQAMIQSMLDSGKLITD
ncbi:MAG: retention module-containing protein [Spongiibacteraceae bacterium]|nr:retention module-containing protein [Spongiibacteraceae bacterium]